MHELSIAEAIADVALRHATGRRVTAVEVRVGALRQVVPDALEFAFELVAQGTALEGARLELQHVPARGRCRSCGADCEMDDFPLRCALCGGLEMDLLAGDELSVEALELDDAGAVTSEGTSHGSHV
jgi:hydrogenase nickel incorporation protein HypA/HybF